MKIDEVRQIRQTYHESECNMLLSKGYQIIKILSSKTQQGDREEVRPVYILGIIPKEQKAE